MNNGGYKASQRDAWSSVALGWEKWWGELERGLYKVSDALIALAGVKDGAKVLDISTGIGEPALRAAARVGARGHVTATDLSPAMLDVARRRAAALKLGNVDFIEMDGEAIGNLDFNQGGAFDAALCRFGLMFFPDPLSALKGVFGKLTKGGRFAAAVWGAPQDVPMISVSMDVVRRELKLAAPTASGYAPGVFALADEGYLKGIFLKAGFKDVRSEHVISTIDFPDVGSYVEFMRDVASPITTLLKDHTPDERERVWGAVRDALLRFVTEDKRLVIGGNKAICIVGTK